MSTSSEARLATEFLTSARDRYRQCHTLGHGALAQCSDADVTRELAPGSNSIAVIVKHMRGNMLSRWTDFLTSDGEKPERQRDREFDDETAVTRDQVANWWDEGYTVCLDTLAALRPEDLERHITIRGEPLTVVDAIHRNLAHTSYHVGQIVLLAKIVRGDGWRTLSIPRGGSEQYTQQLRGR